MSDGAATIPPTPPHDLKAEVGLLGAMLLSRDAIVAAVDVQLSGDDFYDRLHGALYDVMAAMYAHGDIVSTVTLAAELRLVLEELLALSRSPSAARALARRVEEMSLLRRMPAVQREMDYRSRIAALEAGSSQVEDE